MNNGAGRADTAKEMSAAYELLLSWGHVLFWACRAFAEEELIQLLHNNFLILAAGWVQTVLIEQHLAMLGPHAPGLLRDIFVNLLAKLIVKRGFVQARQFLFQLHAKDSVRH